MSACLQCCCCVIALLVSILLQKGIYVCATCDIYILKKKALSHFHNFNNKGIISSGDIPVMHTDFVKVLRLNYCISTSTEKHSPVPGSVL